MISREEVILRDQLEANPAVFGPWPVAKPGYVVFAENMSDEDAELHIKGGQSVDGDFVRQYGSDSLITIPARARMQPAVITDIPKFVALHLTGRINDGVRVQIVTYQPTPDHEVATESLTVV